MKSIFRLVIGLCLFNLLCNQANSQSTPQMLDNLKTVIPPSPDAASLGKYAAWPVSLYTGIPNIDIPIYTVKARTTSVPISLGYHASGFKVGENPSWVGLGWALQSGGVITRSLRGLPDDDPNEGYLVLRQHYANPGDMGSGTTPESIDSTNKVNASQGLADAEPDVYSLNAMGKSYRLFFSGTGTILTEPYSALQITCNWQDSTWKVVMEDGTILNFGGGYTAGHFLDITTNDQISGNPAYDMTEFISSWYLQSIVTTTGETIKFTYTANTITENTFFSQSDNMYNSNSGSGGTGLTTCGCQGQTLQVPGLKTSTGTQQVVSLVPATIESDLTRVEFVQHPTGRQDLQGGFALDSIRVFSKLKNQYIRKFALSYVYAQAINSTVAGSGTGSYYSYRLHLTGLEEIASDNTKPDFWSFQYNPQNLPARLSFAQDYWGYYNGQTSNSSLLPQIFPTQALYSSFSPPIYSVGNRNPDSASMQAEMLTQITYPTGGTTTFNYQPNEYTALAEAYQTYNANGALRLDSTHLSPFVTTYTQVIRVNYPQSITMNCTGSFSPSYVADFGNGIVLGSVNIQENNPPTGHSPIGGGASFTGSGGTQNVVVTLSDTGTYTFTVTIPGASPDEFTTGADYAKCSGSFSYSDSIGMQPETILVGGTRIGSQVIYDGIDTNRNQYISYTYSNPLVIAPLDLQDNFVTTYEEQIKTQAVPCTYYASICFQNYLIRHSASQESFGAVQGGNIGYGTVQTTYGRHGENGYTISTFSGQSDENQTASASFPYPAVTVTDWRRGQLLQETDYTASGQVLRTKVENYQYVVPTYIHGFKTGIILKYNDGTAPGLNTVKYEEEDNKTEQVQRLSSTQTDYDQVNGNPLTTSTSYYYDNPNDLLPVRSITINSKADTVLQYSRTALEESAINTSIPLSSTAIAAIDTMINRNMIGIPLESERYVSGTLAYKTLTNYQVQPTGLVLPSTIMVQNAAYPIETRINFLEYDNYGNLLEQAKSSDENHNYIYDYTANYPIAEVVNGDSTSIAYTSFESNGTGGWILGTGSTDTTKGLTGSKSFVPSAAITRSGLNSSNTYVISYWTTASSSFTVAGTMSGYPIKGKSITLNGYTWTYYEYKVTGITSASVSGSSNIDELRLYPATAQMTTYTYLPLIGVTSKCDADNRVTYYEYDGLQRLKDIKDQDGNVVKTITYHYQGQ